MSAIVLVLLGAVVGACAMYLWCCRTTQPDVISVLPVRDGAGDRAVIMRFDERAYSLTPHEARHFGGACVAAARQAEAS